MSTPEGLTLATILEYLKMRQIYAFRMNTGAGKLTNGASHSSRFVRFGFPGCSDILGILDDGRFLAIEVKSPTGKATQEQLQFLAEIAKRGGVAFIARSIDDVDKHLFAPGYGREEFVRRMNG